MKGSDCSSHIIDWKTHILNAKISASDLTIPYALTRWKICIPYALTRWKIYLFRKQKRLTPFSLGDFVKNSHCDVCDKHINIKNSHKQKKIITAKRKIRHHWLFKL